MLSDLLSQQFCWLTFSHWTTNSANCGRASHTNEKQGTAVLFASQKPGCLLWFQTQPSSSRASPCTAGIEQKSLGKSSGGGVCFYINNSWCNERNIHSIKSFSSPDLEFHMLLCRPFWLPREFIAIIITAVYIPPQANTDQALRELYGNISEQETANPDAAFIIMGDFNKANFRTIAPKYFQHITINTRGDRVLDHCYSPFQDAYKSLPRPLFSKSDHSSVLLLPAYRQKLKREALALRTIQCPSHWWASGTMDNVSDYGSEDSRIDSSWADSGAPRIPLYQVSRSGDLLIPVYPTSHLQLIQWKLHRW